MTRTRVRLATFAAAGLLGAHAALAADLPKRRSGLWQITNSSPGMPAGGMTMQQCIDENTDDMMRQSLGGATDTQCAQQEVRREGERMIVTSVCRMGGTTATTRAVFTGKLDSNYRAEIKSSYDPPMMGMKEGTAVLEAKWLGPCKPGQKPGDMVLPNGMTINPGAMPKMPGGTPMMR
ncbi:MAG: DUF3617 family protein [Pseudomonadota bacterium]